MAVATEYLGAKILMILKYKSSTRRKKLAVKQVPVIGMAVATEYLGAKI
jgi:hypothetical protein